jgi:long-subunit fatty acid transport protein
MGYCFNENPIGSNSVLYNIASPLIIQHTVSTGISYTAADNWMISLCYLHGFRNSVTGSMGVPGSTLTETASADAVSLGISKRF